MNGGLPQAPLAGPRARALAFGAVHGKRAVVDVAAASLAVAFVGALDALVPADLDATALYLGVIALIAWRAFAAVAFVTAVGAWAASIAADLAAGPTNVSSVVLWNGAASLGICLGVAALVRKARVERDALRVSATHDALTGLPNRVLLRDRLEQALLAAGREKLCVGVLMLDLDGFKRVNDTIGHHAGDELLRLAAARVRSSIRSSDTCARIGGDEFAVLLPFTTRAGATRVAEVLGRACAQPFFIAGVMVSVAASVGTALAPEDGTQAEPLLRIADGRMYEAKARTRAAVRDS